MKDILRQKFNHDDLSEKLDNTGTCWIEFRDKDRGWGISKTGRGCNALGKYLVQTRELTRMANLVVGMRKDAPWVIDRGLLRKEICKVVGREVEREVQINAI